MTLSTPLTALLLGTLLLLKHLVAFLFPTSCRAFARAFPRSPFWGTFLLAFATLWTLFLIITSDLGEFSPLRSWILLCTLLAGILFWKFVPELLAARSTGFLLLLAAHPLLEATFLKSGILSLLVSVLAYAWIIGGLFLVGMPYLLRNGITFITAPQKEKLWNLLALLGCLYGLLLFLGGGYELLF